MSCRFCHTTNLTLVLDLGEQALANRFLRESDLGRVEVRYPLRLLLCELCGLVQLDTVVPGDVLFSDYPYRTGRAPALMSHLRDLAREYGGQTRSVLEVGSNDGALLQAFRDTGASVLGVDPAVNIAAIANRAGLDTFVGTFDAEMASSILASVGGEVDVVVARNVFAHVADPHAFLAAVNAVLGPDGVLLVEAPWIATMVEGRQFDQVYHEHLGYLGVRSMGEVLGRHDFVVSDVRVVDFHGGSLLYDIRRSRARPQVSSRVGAALDRELNAGCYDHDIWADFRADIARMRGAFLERLTAYKESGTTVAGYTAPAKGNVFLQWCGIGREDLPWIADTTPEKQGCYTPGTHIPVVHPDRMHGEMPDVLVVLAWNWISEIAADPTITARLVPPYGPEFGSASMRAGR